MLYTGTSLITLNEELTKIQINLQKKEDGSSGGEDGTQIIDSLSAKLVDHNNDTVLGIGDLILSNQKVLPYSTTYTQDDWNNFAHKDKVIAVICVEKKSDSFPAIGLGLLQKDDLIWAATTATCYSASVDNQICTVKKNGEELSTYGDNYNKDTFSFEGRSYGSNGWKEIENKDTSATDNTNKYPIFNYALNYGNTDKLQNSNYKNGWFIPSIKELANISENVSIVNSVLRNLGTEYAQELVFSEYYWSSSQYPGTENAESVWVFSFNENPEEHFVIGTGKNDTKDMNTLVVHEFAGQ